jgi:hypothetical protein
MNENRRKFIKAVIASPIAKWSITAIAQEQPESKAVFTNGKLKAPFDMGVDDNEHRHNWLTVDGDHLALSYPSGLEWGAVFITRGKAKSKPRPYIDMSIYSTIVIEMRGGLGGEQVEIGIKSFEQDDDGSETKFSTKLTDQWTEYKYQLSKFSGAALNRLYVVAEFVFSDAKAQTVLVRNIQYNTRG